MWALCCRCSFSVLEDDAGDSGRARVVQMWVFIPDCLVARLKNSTILSRQDEITSTSSNQSIPSNTCTLRCRFKCLVCVSPNVLCAYLPRCLWLLPCVLLIAPLCSLCLLFFVVFVFSRMFLVCSSLLWFVFSFVFSVRVPSCVLWFLSCVLCFSPL